MSYLLSLVGTYIRCTQSGGSPTLASVMLVPMMPEGPRLSHPDTYSPGKCDRGVIEVVIEVVSPDKYYRGGVRGGDSGVLRWC